MEATIQSILATRYGLRGDLVQEVPGGWSARAFVARGKACGWFVKLYDKRRVSTRPWIEKIDAYTPTVLWLYHNTRLRRRMTAPLLTNDGAYKVTDGAYVWMVFPLIEGETLGEAGLDSERARQLALILAALHAHDGGNPEMAGVPRETYALPFADGFEALLRGTDVDDLRNALSPHLNRLWRGMETLRSFADDLRCGDSRPVLCHTDVHGWNLMWAGRLVLIDWEGLLFAPPEADLFVFTDGFFFDYAREVFFQTYREARGGYVENEAAMAFYRLRRRLEDIAAFADSIAHDGLSPGDTLRSLRYMKKECEALAAGWPLP